MTLIGEFLIFALALFLIIKGGDFFVGAASWIAKISGIPQVIIGATIVSLATTLPEMLVSIVAASEGQADMAVGNAVGSVSANTGLILGVALLFAPCAAPRAAYARKGLLLIFAAALLPALCLRARFTLAGGALLILIFAAFVCENLRDARKPKAAPASARPTLPEIIWGVARFVCGAAWIVVGSHMLVESGAEIARALGVPARVVAVTMVAIGTSLPELVTMVASLAKREGALSIGNILGANILDLTLILPACTLASGVALPVSWQSVFFDMPVCLLLVLTALLPALCMRRFARGQGAALLLIYGAYLALTVL